MKKIAIWFAGFFEDQRGSASSKRMTLYLCLLMLWHLVSSAASGNITDISYSAFQMSIWVVGAVVLFLVGAITSEFFNILKLPGDKFTEKKL
jgi:hypothetical protein